MVSTTPESDEEPIDVQDDSQTKHMDTLWDVRFEQLDPPTEDKLVQVNMGMKENPQPIFINDTLTPLEKEELTSLIREYIDVFAWNYEDMSELDSQFAMHRLNIQEDAKPVK